MKLFVAFMVFAGALGIVAPAAETSPAIPVASRAAHRVVFELTSGELEGWNAVLNNIENVRKSLGETSTQIELVAHGQGLDFLRSTHTVHVERMRKLAQAGVIFAACENTMKRQKVTKADLMPFATTVDSGVAEIVRRQEDQWSYIRSTN